MAILQPTELLSAKGKITKGLIVTILVIGAFIQILPIALVLMGSVKAEIELISPKFILFPKEWQFGNYITAWKKYNLAETFYNTVEMCVLQTFLRMTTSILAGYAFSKLKTRLSNFFFMFFLASMMFSPTALIFPKYIFAAQLGLVGHKISRVLFSGVTVYYIVLFKSFFDGISTELTEASMIDGCGKIRSLITIIMPLSKPIMAVCAVRMIIASYNGTVFPLLLLPNKEHWTIMMKVFSLNSASMNIADMYVLLALSIIPLLIVFAFFQKYIVEGISAGGVKG